MKTNLDNQNVNTLCVLYQYKYQLFDVKFIIVITKIETLKKKKNCREL